MKPELNFRVGHLFVAFCIGMAFAAVSIYRAINNAGEDSDLAVLLIATQTTFMLGAGSIFSLFFALGQWRDYRKKMSEWMVEGDVPF